MGFILTKAVRRAVPILASLSGTSGSGKTFSGLLLAAGLAGPGGKVGMIDAENGRGSLYADDPDIMAALPDGFTRTDIGAPYTPKRYTEAVTAFEAEGFTVCLIDSTSHEWEGEGGCCDLAENNKLRGMPNWAMAKREHKKFLAHCMASPMHIIFCLRARDKVKILERGDIVPATGQAAEKSMVIPMGLQPIAEKNFVFEQLLSLGFDESSHHAYPIKVPKMLTPFFPGGRLITKRDGERIREWNQSGAAMDLTERLLRRAEAEALKGVEAYRTFFGGLSAAQKKSLPHERLKADAVAADAAAQPDFQTHDSLEAALQADAEFAEVGGKRYQLVDGNYREFQEAA